MIYCGVWEFYGVFRFTRERCTILEPFGLRKEWYDFHTWQLCLPPGDNK